MSTTEDQIEEILAPHTPQIRALVSSLRKLVQAAAPDLNEEPKSGWKNITYTGKGVVLAIMPYTKYVSLHFYQGVQLDDPLELLEGGGKKLRHVKVHSTEDIMEHRLTPLIEQAVALDKG